MRKGILAAAMLLAGALPLYGQSAGLGSIFEPAMGGRANPGAFKPGLPTFSLANFMPSTNLQSAFLARPSAGASAPLMTVTWTRTVPKTAPPPTQNPSWWWPWSKKN